MNDEELCAAQADTAEVLTALLREHTLPAVSWHISSVDGSLQGQIYRDSTEQANADLVTIAELLNTEVSEVSSETSDGGTAWTQLSVQGQYRRVPIAVFGQASIQPQ